VLLERPLNAETLASAAESAVRARRRQYAAREHLEELKRTRSELERLNRELEDRILTRTRELASANDRLMKEINERERAQAALTQVQKMEAIGRLTGGIAHDFNNLLHVVNMNLELVSLYAKEEKVRPVVERAKSAARRGARLTNQLLSFARSQSLLPRLTRVNQLLLGMKDLLEISVGSGIEVELDLCEEDASVVLDASQLEMAILNLAVNSRDAMPEGGKLKITTGTRFLDDDPDLPAGDYVLVSITDSGTGIPANVLPKVFDPFFTTKGVEKGTGLGLSQVYGFAHQAGGTVRLTSKVDVGTKVTLYLPRSKAETTPVQVEQGTTIPGGRELILLVEDNPEVQSIAAGMLEELGYAVRTADSASRALDVLKTEPAIDLVLTDIVMPGPMDGMGLAQHLSKEHRGLKILLTTGYSRAASDPRSRFAVLRKPYQLETMARAVRKALDAH
jgi:signal transduction histidine kinase